MANWKDLTSSAHLSSPGESHTILLSFVLNGIILIYEPWPRPEVFIISTGTLSSSSRIESGLAFSQNSKSRSLISFLVIKKLYRLASPCKYPNSWSLSKAVSQILRSRMKAGRSSFFSKSIPRCVHSHEYARGNAVPALNPQAAVKLWLQVRCEKFPI